MERVDYESVVIQDVFNWIKNDEIDLDPWYQRRSVWTPTQKSFLINTLLSGKPVPTIYVRHKIDLEKEKSIKEVVDGQQRLRAIGAFVNGDISTRHPKSGERVNYQDLRKAERERFLLTKLSVGYLIGADDPDVIDIFARINSVAKTLNAQEKRNAAFGGEYKQFCLQEASERTKFWRQNEIFTANNIARMVEVQFISEIVFNLLNGLSDSSPTNLNKAYEKYDEKFKEWPKIKTRINKVFDLLGALPEGLLRDTIFSRQPIFFSLVLALDSKGKVGVRKLSNALVEMDARFNSDVPLSQRPATDVRFREACTASTQRLSSRRVRDRYIKSFLR